MARGSDAPTALVVEVAALAKAMKLAASIVESRNTIPILANVRLTVAGDQLELVTTDLDLQVRIRVPVKVAVPLALTVDARRLASLLAALPGGAQVSFEKLDARLQVKSGRSKWLLPVLPFEDFPVLTMPDGDAPLVLTLSLADLASAAGRVAHSVSTEEHRYYLNGTLFDAEGGKLRLVSTDGIRLTAVTLAADLAEGTGMIVPRKFIAALRAFEDVQQVTLALDPARHRLRAMLGDAEVTGKTIDSFFPDYRRVIPPDTGALARFDPADMRAAIRRLAVVEEGKTNSVTITPEEDKLVLRAVSDSGAEAEEEVPAECSAAGKRGFNGRYLDQMLDALGGDTIELLHEDAGAPALFRRVPGDGALGVITPLRM